MILVLSPSKTLDFATPHALKSFSQPCFLPEAETLVKKLRTFSQKQIAELMELSDKLAALNVQRFADFHTPFTPENARPALLAFKGDVYESMEVAAYDRKEWDFAQAHVRILSGLYGLLRPLDLIQAYRLEMGRKLAVGKTRNLYAFWGDRPARALNAELGGHKSKLLINLASEEYATAIDRKALGLPVIDMVFKENKGGALKIVGLFAKRARGAMADYVIKNRLDTLDALKDFSGMGYRFQPKLSTQASFVFSR